MASSRLSSNSPDWLDVGEIVKAFQQMNACVIMLYGKVEPVGGNRELVFLIQAEELDPADVAPAVLASVKCHIGSGGHRTMESAILWALYKLDWMLAQQQLAKKEPIA